MMALSQTNNSLIKRLFQSHMKIIALLYVFTMSFCKSSRLNLYLLSIRSKHALFNGRRKAKLLLAVLLKLVTIGARLSVIIYFPSPVTCLTAIDLDELSFFPGEGEVILLPFTLFKVASIDQRDEHGDQHEITMENIPKPRKSL
jgi:hypothetical protein